MPTQDSPRYLVTLSLWTTIILWGSAFVGIRVGLQDWGAGSLALVRYLIASVGMVVLYRRLPSRQRVSFKDGLQLLGLGIIGIGIYNVALNRGEVTVSAGVASFVIGLMPLLALWLSVWRLRECITPRMVMGAGVSMLGLALLVLAERNVHVGHGVWLVLLAAVAGAVYTVFQKPVLKRFHPIEVTAFAIWGGAFVLLGFLPDALRDSRHVTPLGWFSVIYLGLFPATIAYALWSYALSRIPASQASFYLYGMPVVSTILGVLLLGERPSALSCAGGVVAVAGAFLASWKRRVKAQRIPIS